MTTKYFTLDDGVLELHKDRIVIFDETKKKKLLDRIGAACGFIYAVTCVGRGFKENDNALLYFGIFLLVTWTILIIADLKKYLSETLVKEIDINNISKVTFKNCKSGETQVGMIKTKQNKFRHINISKVDFQDLKLQDELMKINIETVQH